MALRKLAQQSLEMLQFYMDRYPGLPYQPLPWLGLNKAKRGSGTEERWAVIEQVAKQHKIGTALDVGCNVGYFCLRLSELGIGVVGMEMSSRYYRLAKKAAGTMRSNPPVFVSQMMTPDDVFPLAAADLVLNLSVWHHWVRAFGFDNATAMLKRVWSHCNRVMLFETGEAEVQASYHLPEMQPDARTWLAKYLAEITGGAQIEHLGNFKAFSPGGDEEKNVVYRNLFSVTRVQPI